MENRRYKVNRSDIYVGEVVRTNNIYRSEHDSCKIKAGQLTICSWFSYRSMLFVPNEEKFSNDLLYNSPSYPVLNVTDDDICLNLEKESIVVKDAYNLNHLLEFFGYDKELTFEDIMKIRNTFFTGRFARDHSELFGYKETMAEDLTFYAYGKEVTDPKELEKHRRKFRADQKAGHRMFGGIYESPLSSEYFDVLDDRGDNTFMDSITYLEKMNAFAPDKREGKIKMLAK